jgi:dTDP-4-dehydrorhamnose 3,5-epimerase
VKKEAEGMDAARFAVALEDDVRRSLSFQSYARGESIDGVWLRQLRKHHGENGWFVELYRMGDAGIEGLPQEERFPLRQTSVSYAEPGRINAFHIHPVVAQDELWTVVQGQLLVWLVDCRAESATAGLRQRIVLTGEAPAVLHIPAGVAHGYRSGASGALLIYGMNQQFDANRPNEGRLAWDFFGAELWAEDRG